MRRWLYWTPRLLALVCTLVAGLLVADARRVSTGFWGIALTLVLQLLPVWLILIALVIAWRWEKVGGAVFLALGALGLLQSWGQLPGSVYMVLGGPLLVVSGLFLADAWYQARGLRPGPAT